MDGGQRRGRADRRPSEGDRGLPEAALDLVQPLRPARRPVGHDQRPGPGRLRASWSVGVSTSGYPWKYPGRVGDSAAARRRHLVRPARRRRRLHRSRRAEHARRDRPVRRRGAAPRRRRHQACREALADAATLPDPFRAELRVLALTPDGRHGAAAGTAGADLRRHDQRVHRTRDPPEERAVKIFLSSDMEGTAGVVDWSQCIGPGPEYQYYRRLLQDEVNAAIEGALAAGATEFLVNDSHSTMQNLRPDELHGRRALPLRAAQADVHDAGARRILRRRLLRQLPRLDGQRGLDAVPHLQPAGHRPGAAQRRRGRRVRHQRPGRARPRRAGRAGHRRRHHRRGGGAGLPRHHHRRRQALGDPLRGRVAAPGGGPRAHPRRRRRGRPRAGRRGAAADQPARHARGRLPNGDFAEMATWVAGRGAGRRPHRRRSPATTPSGCSGPSSRSSC